MAAKTKCVYYQRVREGQVTKGIGKKKKRKNRPGVPHSFNRKNVWFDFFLN